MQPVLSRRQVNEPAPSRKTLGKNSHELSTFSSEGDANEFLNARKTSPELWMWQIQGILSWICREQAGTGYLQTAARQKID